MKRIAKCLFWIIVFSMVVTVPVQAASKKTQKITVKAGEDINKEYGDKAFALGAQAKTKLKYKSSAPGVVKVNKKGVVSIKGSGIAIITIKAKATNEYKAAMSEVYISVKPQYVRKPIASVILLDGTEITAESGEKLPASKLEGAKVVFTGLETGTVWMGAIFATWGQYWIEEDQNVNWAYNAIYYHPEEKELYHMFLEETGWTYMHDVSEGYVIDKSTAQYFLASGYWDYDDKWVEDDYGKASHLYVMAVSSTGRYVNGGHTYEHNFEVDWDR